MSDVAGSQGGTRKRSVLAIPALIALIAAGCGSSDDDNGGGATGTGAAGGGGIYSSTTGAGKPPATAGAAVIKVAHGTGGVFLTDAQGRTLYSGPPTPGRRAPARAPAPTAGLR